jgi:APA family basic amino acid/polyamine antiporter
MVIGSGIFFKPGIVFRNAGSASMGLMAWLLGGIITLAAGLTVAEIAAAMPRTGGLYAYLSEIYGRIWGFLLGWVQTLIYTPGAMAAQAIVFTTQLTLFFPMSPGTQKLVALAAIALLVGLNCLSTKQGGALQAVATVGKLVPIILIIVVGLLRGSGGRIVPDVPLTGGIGLGAAILATLWAYDGWIAVTNVAAEVHNPGRLLPRAIISGIGLVTVVYVGINVAMLRVLPVGVLASSATPAADVAKALFGPTGATLIAIGILVSIFGALNGYTLTGARVPFAMAQADNLPFARLFGHVHPRFGTPAATLLLEGFLSIFYVLIGSFNRLTDLVVFVLWVFFAMALVGVYLLRVRQPDLPRPYRVPLYPVLPAIALIGGLYILVSTLINAPGDALFGLGLTALGFPAFWLLERSKGKRPART